MQVVEAMTGRAWRVARGDVVVLTDIEGSQVADLFLVDADDVAATGSATAARSTTAAGCHCRSARVCTRRAAG
jgi:uncharacterized protein YcgI (DUF1989 family)